MIIIIYILTLIVFGFIYVKKFRYRCLDKVPSPPTHPIFGHILYLKGDAEEKLEILRRLNDSYGPVVKLWINPLKPTVVVSDPEIIEILLSSNAHLEKSSLYKCVGQYFGESIVTAPVETWKTERKLINTAFHPKLLTNLIEVFEDHGNKFIKILNTLHDKSWVDISKYTEAYILDVICDSLMNAKTNFQRNTNKEFIEARNQYMKIFVHKMYSPYRLYDFLFRLSKDYYNEIKYVKILKRFSQNIIDTRREERNTSAKADYEIGEKQIFLDMLLDIKNVTDKKLRDHVDTFLIAGYESLDSVISFTLFELARQPNIQEKVLQELISIVGKDQNAIITHTDMLQMKYLECVIKESLRFYTTTPFVERVVGEDIQINGFTILKGMEVSISLHALHNDERHHPHPRRFDPGRFKPENEKNIRPYTFIPFLKGPRNCIGKQFAMMVMKSALAKVLLNFELLPVQPEHTIKYTTEFVLKSFNGVPVRLQERVL